MSVLCGAMRTMVFNGNRIESQIAGIALARTIGRNGLRPPTLKLVAEEANMGVSTLHQWFAGKQNMAPHAAAGLACIFWSQIAERVNQRGWSGYLPSSEDDSFFLRAWLGIEELARSDDDVGEAVRELWHDARFWLRSSVGRDLSDFEAGQLVITLRGLWDRLVSADPIDPDLAERLWAAAYTAICEDQSDQAA